MVVPKIWIRNNMLFPSEQQQTRQLTKAEIKFQRSLQQLPVPDWYLNKRSNPPKIVNGSPIEFRPPSWKCSTPKNSSTNSSFSNLSVSDTYSTGMPITRMKKSSKPINSNAFSCRQKSPESKNRKFSSRSSNVKEEIFDTWIPEANPPMNVSKTLPKVSPSRKIQNINLVLPPVPMDNISNNLDNEIISNNYTNNNLFFTKKQSTEVNIKNDSIRNDEPPWKKNNVENAMETPGRLPYFFRIRATSTPKFSPAKLFSSTLIEDSPKPKKNLSQSILEKSSIFEKSCNSKDSSEMSIDHCRSPKVSQNLLEKTFIFDNSRADQSFQNYEDMSTTFSRGSSLLDRNIDPMEPTFYGKDDSSLSVSKSSSMVREMVKKLEASGTFQTPSKTSTFTWKKQAPVQTKKSNLELKPPVIQQKRFNFESRTPGYLYQEEDPAIQSPCTRFLKSNKKSTELENVVRSKQLTSQKGVVRGIIEILAEKVNQSTLPREKKTAQVNQNFVKNVVNALESMDRSNNTTVSKNRRISVNKDAESGSEFDRKSYTSASVKDTDSGSDSDQRTPILKSDDENRFDYSDLETTNVHQEDDSVYWIPVSKCKLPKTSSLLSMMSRLSINEPSPCMSPIRSDSEMEYCQEWGVTYKRTSSLSRKFFRIDETVIIDSGYSDKSY